MNKFIKELAQPVKTGEETNYAVIIIDGNKQYGLFDVSSDEATQESLKKMATNIEDVPYEILTVAMGVVNTIHMSKTGSEWPLFIDIPALDDNTIQNENIDWKEYELTQKNANRPGVVYNGQFLPLDKKANVEAAADLLAERAKDFRGIDRVKFATAIKSAAERLKIKVNDTVEKYAYGTLNPDFYDLMDQRIEVAKDYPETKKLLEEIKTDAPTMMVDKVAEVLDVIDRMLPFSVKFATQHTLGSDRPMFFSSISVPDAFDTVYGKQVRPRTFVEKVANLDNEKLGQYFTPVFVEKLKADPEDIINRATPAVKSKLRQLIA